MDEIRQALQQAGLSESEQSVYLALLQHGEMSKTPLVRTARISASKVYDVTDRLISKGLVSSVLRDDVKHFQAAPPVRVLSYLEDQQQELEAIKQEFSTVLPQLEELKENQPEAHDVQVYRGWNGLRTVYDYIMEVLKPGEFDYVIGASVGENVDFTRVFYDRTMTEYKERGIPIKVIFNENARKGFENRAVDTSHIEARYLSFSSPTEINIAGDYTFIITLTEEPAAIRIHSKKTADGFREYFDTLWKLAKP